VAAGLVALAVVARLLRPGSDLAILALVVAILCVLPLLAWAARWTWRKLTYRVGVRLFISYLLIGLTPFALFAGLVLVLGYVLVGQYAGRRVGNEMERLSGAMAARAGSAVRELAQGRAEYARELLRAGGTDKERGMREEWLLADASGEWRSAGAAGLPLPRWVDEGGWQGEVVHGAAAYLAAVERRGSRFAAVLMPLDIANARAFAPGGWYEVRFVAEVKRATAATTGDRNATIAVAGEPGERSTFRIDGQPVLQTEVEEG